MIVMALDSAQLTGFAIVARSEAGSEVLVRHGVATVRTAGDVEALVADLTAVTTPDVVAVEEPFVHPRNPSTGLVLARLLGRWLQALELRGLPTVTIPASMWQMGLLPGISSRTPSPARKVAAQAFALDRFGVLAAEDAADAICLAAFVARTATRRAA
jgi:Holliday junction resolvasome RuvABC endonuclease subunit